MSPRIQVILSEEEASEFRSQARRESKSLSAWLRQAGRKALEMSRTAHPLTDAESLQRFFEDCDQREHGKEPEWEEHKRLIVEGYRGKAGA